MQHLIMDGISLDGGTEHHTKHFKRAAFTLRLCPSDQYCTKTVGLLEPLDSEGRECFYQLPSLL